VLTEPWTDRSRARPRRARGDGRAVAESRLCDLLEAIGAERSHVAFSDLFHRLAPRVKRALVRRGASLALAEELTQETMLAVWRHAATFDRRRASALTWVLTIARNKQLDLIRRATRFKGEELAQAEQERSAAQPDLEQILHAKQSSRILQDAITVLPREQGLLIREAFGKDKTHREIAAEQALPLGTVKSRLRLALAHLRASLPASDLV
jgi:RNA polymerase sigma-70 factor (ECF subfamily)